ncbi:hypothetical protein D9756_008618 [Leucocoprinus leucothites]|uniref:Uncharacterized protein n=1 Tax=Leucocoprinus leucothites TaxID=201217 RepID=A0A8H5FVV4_9AGAR|nr:hypothetical protein D9756_008618 [Leucoagaricus leucothites]
MLRSFNSLPVFRKSQALIENVPTNHSRESLPPQDDFLDSGAQRDTLRAIEDDRQDDILFAVIGEDKSGISKVVELLTGIGNISCASEVQAIRIREHENLKDRVVLLVAPKLDGTLGSEKTALEQIEKWLADLRQRNTDPGISVNLRGLLSLYKITPPIGEGGALWFITIFIVKYVEIVR